MISFAVPLEGVDNWLAEIDLVFLLEAEGAAPIIGRRTDLSKHAGHLIERLPPAVARWKVLGSPDGACPERLRVLATTVEAIRLR